MQIFRRKCYSCGELCVFLNPSLIRAIRILSAASNCCLYMKHIAFDSMITLCMYKVLALMQWGWVVLQVFLFPLQTSYPTMLQYQNVLCNLASMLSQVTMNPTGGKMMIQHIVMTDKFLILLENLETPLDNIVPVQAVRVCRQTARKMFQVKI